MTGKLSILCVAANLALAGSALADHRSGGRAAGPFGTRLEAYLQSHHEHVDHHGRVWAPERYETREHRVVIPAAYETVYEKVWVEPVYEWVTREVWVPARRRDHIGLNLGKFSLHLDLGGHHGRHDRGHYKTIREWMLVWDGYYETITRQILVRPERVRIVPQRILVHEGHWKDVGGFAAAPPYDTVRRLPYRGTKRKLNLPGSRSVRRASREFKRRH